MRLLLDTHIWVWSQLDPDRLSRRVRTAFVDPAAELWLSSISVWEVLLLIERGRVTVTGEPSTWVEDALRAGPYREAPVTHRVALESRRVSLPHQDPADRFLAATARVLDLALVTADARLLAARPCKTLANN
ncbi:MAG TPA: type II toxin-antitoxin system VapC family toxin [Gemmatimonadales bacterium]|nr:type II toxin-antitoxin system VapC family toxin [Gemmatimonadales bacterium]